MSVFEVVYSKNSNTDSHYHRRSCPRAKALPLGIRRSGVAAQLRQWGLAPCPKCDPDNLAYNVKQIARIARDGKKSRSGRKGGRQ